jgi:cyclohexadieny/prephenate dehydrogenase
MAQVVRKLAVIGQGLIGSSITRAVVERGIVAELVVTDSSEKVRRRVRELGLGEAKVVDTGEEAVADADLVIICVPVGQIAKVAAEIAPAMKAGAILSDVGSVKASVVADILPALPDGIHLVPAHPLAGTEQSGPEAGLPSLFINRWCILTPPDGTDGSAVEKAKQFWEALGSKAEIMTPEHHDYVLSITSHLPHVAAYSIFHTALRYERETNSDVVKFSAGGFRDFTRIASSNPAMWRDIFLGNKDQVLEILRRFMGDLDEFAKAIEAGDGEKLEKLLSTSRLTRRKVIEKEHISLQPKPDSLKSDRVLARPYSSDF